MEKTKRKVMIPNMVNSKYVKNLQQVLNIFNAHTDENGTIIDEDVLVKILDNNRNIVEKSLYFKDFADGKYIVEYYKTIMLPRLKENGVV